MELAKDCVRMCHVLKTVAEGNDVDSSSSSRKNQIEDLGRCVSTQPVHLC